MKLLKAVSIYTVTSILVGGINFFLMPLFTFYLTTEDFGYYSLITSYVSFLTPVLLLGVVGISTIEYYKLDKQEFRRYLGSALIFPSLLFVVFSITAFLFTEELSIYTGIPSLWILLLPLMSYVGVYYQLMSSFYQLQEKPVFYGILNISYILLGAGIALVFIVQMNFNFEGRLFGLLISSVLFAFLSLALLLKSGLLSFNTNTKYIKSALKHGMPLIPHSISFMVIDLSDRIFIAEMVGVDELGIYNIGYQLGVVLLVIINAFVQGYSPFLFQMLEQDKHQSKIKLVRVSYLFIISLFVILAGICILNPYIFKYFIDEKFHGGMKYVFWVGLGYIFLGMYKMIVGVIFFQKKTLILSYLSYLNVFVNLALNYFLILEFGAIGAAYATALSFLIVFVVAFYISNRLYSLPWLNFRAICYEKFTN